MSLELALQENTLAIRELIAALAKQPPTTKAAKTKPMPAAAQPAEAPPTKAEPAPPAAPESASAEQPVNYDTAKESILDVVAQHGTAAAAEILNSFGASNLQQVPAEQWPAVIQACRQRLGAQP